MKELSDKIWAADGVYISTPEHNFTISAAIKNIIDWISIMNPNPFVRKPIALASTASGSTGGARALYDLRKTLVYSDAVVMNKHEVLIGANYSKFDKEGNLIDEKSRKAVED